MMSRGLHTYTRPDLTQILPLTATPQERTETFKYLPWGEFNSIISSLPTADEES